MGRVAVPARPEHGANRTSWPHRRAPVPTRPPPVRARAAPPAKRACPGSHDIGPEATLGPLHLSRSHPNMPAVHPWLPKRTRCAPHEPWAYPPITPAPRERPAPARRSCACALPSTQPGPHRPHLPQRAECGSVLPNPSQLPPQATTGPHGPPDARQSEPPAPIGAAGLYAPERPQARATAARAKPHPAQRHPSLNPVVRINPLPPNPPPYAPIWSPKATPPTQHHPRSPELAPSGPPLPPVLSTPAPPLTHPAPSRPTSYPLTPNAPLLGLHAH